jgi:trigger factor
MDVRVEDLGPTRKRIHVVVPEEMVRKEIDEVYLQLRKTAKVKGFRPGKTPRHILERYYGEYVTEQVRSKLITDTYEGALDNGKVDPVSQPTLESEEPAAGEPFEYSALVEVNPEIEVKDYVGVSVEKKEITIEEDETTKRLDHLLDLHARLEVAPEERPIREGDFAVIDFQGTIDGRPFKGGKGENVTLEVGGGRFLADLEKALVGLRATEEKEVDVTFPEDHSQRTLAGRKATFHVKIGEIREKVLPSLDDEFAKDVGCDSLKDLTEKTRKEIEGEKQGEVDRDIDRQILDFLIAENAFEVPQSMVERRLEAMVRELKLNLAYQGVEFRTAGLDERKLKEEYRDEAVRDVKSALLLKRIADKEGISVTEEEVGQKFEEIALKTNRTRNQVETYYKKNNMVDGLKGQLVEEKTLQLLRDRAQITTA